MSSMLLRRRLAAAFVAASFVSGVEDMVEVGDLVPPPSSLFLFVGLDTEKICRVPEVTR